MRYFKFIADTEFVGTKNTRYVAFPDDVTDKELQRYANDFTRDNGESFEYLVFGWGTDPVADGDMTKEEYEQQLAFYYEDCSCEYFEITEEEFIENEGEDA